MTANPESHVPNPKDFSRLGSKYCAGALCLVVFACALMWSFSSGVHARQPRTARDGVYTSAQAVRGQAVYQGLCAACHGATLQGDIGPPLAGQGFLGIWDPRPLADLFDKIHNTMPADKPRDLTRRQVADVVAYVLQANHFPGGSVELAADDAALRQIVLAPAATGASPAASSAAGAAVSFPAVGNLNQVMRGILFPSSNVLFDVQTQDPGGRQTPGARAEAATTTARYGDVYDPWMVVDAAAISIAEAGPLLMTRGRRCENGRPVPSDRSDWQQYVQGLVEAGRAAYRASQSRNQEAVGEVTNQISDACANCHRVYRDTPAAAMRCTPPP
jgi:mono/diheme cytochrome c family protein